MKKNKFLTGALYNRALAITPGKLAEIEGFAQSRLAGEPVAFDMEAMLGGEQAAYEIINGVAVIPVDGVISQRMNLFSAFSGGTSTELLTRDVQDAIADPAVISIVLNIDSPGGEVSGTQAVSDAIYAARGIKPIIAMVNPLAASAAYWIASAADEIIMAESTSVAGSIGVVAMHQDVSAAMEKKGLKHTEIFAGKYKRIASSYSALSEEGAATIQADVDYLYSLFVDAVARNRGVDAQTVIANMADGRMFIGQQAIDAGLVDCIESFDAVMTRLSKPNFNQENRMAENQQPVITIDTLRQNHAALVEQISAEGFKAGIEMGAHQERERITGIMAVSTPGFEKETSAAISDGKMTSGDLASAIIKAHKERGVSLGAIAADGTTVPHAPPKPEADEATERASAASAIAGGMKRR